MYDKFINIIRQTIDKYAPIKIASRKRQKLHKRPWITQGFLVSIKRKQKMYTTDWKNRRSHRVFLCFYSAIFQLTSAKFQTFAYNSRTVRSSYMKLWQQFSINELNVCTKIRGKRSRDFGFRTQKPPRRFGVKSGLSQKRLKCGKKYFM